MDVNYLHVQIICRYTWPETLASTGKPAVKYQQAKYSVAQIIRYGISETACAAMKANQWYVLDFFSRVSKTSRFCRKKGCIWLMHPGATKIKLTDWLVGLI